MLISVLLNIHGILGGEEVEVKGYNMSGLLKSVSLIMLQIFKVLIA